MYVDECKILFMYSSFYHYIVSFFIFLYGFCFKVILSDISSASPAFFSFPFTWNVFFHSLTFSLCVSLDPKQVSYRHHIYGSCFCIHSATLCLLIGAFSLFTFKVIIDRYVLIASLLFWGFCSSVLFLSSSFVLFPCYLMTIFSVIFGILSVFCVCVYCRFLVYGYCEVCMCICVYIYVYIYTHIYTYMCVYIYIFFLSC